MDKLSPDERSENMRRIRSSGTSPEELAARLLRECRVRFRRHVLSLPGRPDFANFKLKKAIFVHGCFWHQHKICVDGRAPKSNPAYWEPKLERNHLRDVRARRKLRRMGWSVVVVWECQLERKPEVVLRKLYRLLARPSLKEK